MQKQKAKQGLPLLDFPAKDFLSIPTQSNVTVKTNSLSRSWSGNTPRSCRSKWDLNGQICSPAISIWQPIPGDFPRCHVRKSCAALIYGIGGCLILQSPEMLGKYGSWWVVKIQWRARWSLNTFCFVLLFLQFPVSAWLPSIPILVRKLLDIS